MAQRKYTSNLDYQQILYLKYFRGITPTSMIDVKPLVIDEGELKALLQSYGLESHFTILSKLASLTSSFLNHWKKGKDLMNALDEIHNQEIDLLNLAWMLKTGKVSWLELVCNTGDKVKLTHLASILELGEAINIRFSNIKSQDELTKLEKTTRKKGKPPSKMPLQKLSFKILKYLNNETDLKSGDSFISNKQANFIFDFLQLAEAIKPDSTIVLDAEYIRTLLNNYKAKFPEFY
jgi:hypothetical protein